MGGGHACVGIGEEYGKSIPSTDFAVNPKLLQRK